MSSKQRFPSKHARELAEEAKQLGWKLDWNGSKHMRFVHPQCKPIFGACSPRDPDLSKKMSLCAMKREMKRNGVV